MTATAITFCVLERRIRVDTSALPEDGVRWNEATSAFGFFSEAKSHTAVAAAVAQGRADWGVAIQSVADDQGLGFHFLQDEEYDFIFPESRMERPSVQAFLESPLP